MVCEFEKEMMAVDVMVVVMDIRVDELDKENEEKGPIPLKREKKERNKGE